ncbi:DUF3618 domain-containing protein [Streptomyces sp. NPDC006733]|uniref:DUF3618 domain-containing protein n=1 Tax=Streptomyces sp. NPDC006733 TaxID=3155460 RepID=UPI0033F30F8A
MDTSPDDLKDTTDATRAHLARSVDQLADKVQPGRIVRRRADALQRRLSGVKERVMGTASEVSARSGGAAQGISEQIGQAPQQVREQTRGNPLAAGLIAFGAGMLAGTLLPATTAEQRAGRQLREHAGELVDPVRNAAAESAEAVRSEMREPVQQAVGSVKGAAQDALEATREQGIRSGREGAEELRETGQQTAQQARRRTDTE